MFPFAIPFEQIVLEPTSRLTFHGSGGLITAMAPVSSVSMLYPEELSSRSAL